ncbi:unnamed protein product, partial [Heligmosomoides polygyrus]|uniref:C-type lectin domain-containing protein n=1 Tax=Heligmosomoides polygyrus TaxID=6339 RepID=A0A183F5T0_HELPZ
SFRPPIIVSEVECIASWHSLGHVFFAARVGNRRGESYRCFIVDKTGTSGRIGISADASCQELTHIGAATTTLHYKHDHKIHSQCTFPDYMQSEQGPTRQSWDSIVTGRRNVIQNGHWISSYQSRNDTVWTCLESRRQDHITAVRAHVRRGCQTGYQCVQVSSHTAFVCALLPLLGNPQNDTLNKRLPTLKLGAVEFPTIL